MTTYQAIVSTIVGLLVVIAMIGVAACSKTDRPVHDLSVGEGTTQKKITIPSTPPVEGSTISMHDVYVNLTLEETTIVETIFVPTERADLYDSKGRFIATANRKGSQYNFFPPVTLQAKETYMLRFNDIKPLP